MIALQIKINALDQASHILQHLHVARVSHGNIHSENFMYIFKGKDKKVLIKIIDNGSSLQISNTRKELNINRFANMKSNLLQNLIKQHPQQLSNCVMRYFNMNKW